MMLMMLMMLMMMMLMMVMMMMMLMMLMMVMIDQGGRFLSSTGEQVLRGPGCGGCCKHHASHFDKELPCRHSSHHSAAAVPQQGQSTRNIISQNFCFDISLSRSEHRLRGSDSCFQNMAEYPAGCNFYNLLI